MWYIIPFQENFDKYKMNSNFLHDNVQEDFDLREQVVESEIEDSSDIELEDLLVRI